MSATQTFDLNGARFLLNFDSFFFFFQHLFSIYNGRSVKYLDIDK